jgi:hypothetical protein
MSNTWAVVVAALGSAFLSTGGAFWLDAHRARRRANEAKALELKTACTLIISGAQRLLFKAAALHINMEVRSGLRESLDLVLHHRKPIDILELNDYLMIEQGRILDAQATIWLTGDEALITSAGDVVAAVGKLIVAAAALPPDFKLDESADLTSKVQAAIQHLRPLKHDPESEAKINERARNLGRTCVAFGHAMRTSLKVDDVDAILRAMPGFSLSEAGDSLVSADSVEEAQA